MAATDPGPALSRLPADDESADDAPNPHVDTAPAGPGMRHNWAGSRAYHATTFVQPRSVEQLQHLVATTARIHALGSRHSFNGIADTPGTQVGLSHLPRQVEVDARAGTATVSGGLTYGDIVTELDEHGVALGNLASLPHISVAGATATGTHGSGVDNQTLSAAVVALEFVTGTGEIVTISRAQDPDVFAGCVVHLGALGIVTRVTLSVVPAFTAHQWAWTNLTIDGFLDNFATIMSMAHSVSAFTRWRDGIDFVLAKSTGAPEDAPRSLFGAGRATGPCHPIPGARLDNLTMQGGVPGQWYDRLPHFRLDAVPSHGAEIQSEYFVPRTRAQEAVAAMFAIGHRLGDLLQVAEIRTIAADDLWLSPARHQATVALHFTWRRDADGVRAVLPIVERALAPMGAVPHWGKLFTTGRSMLADHYRRLGDFRDLADRFDPQGRFRNDFLDGHVL